MGQQRSWSVHPWCCFFASSMTRLFGSPHDPVRRIFRGLVPLACNSKVNSGNPMCGQRDLYDKYLKLSSDAQVSWYEWTAENADRTDCRGSALRRSTRIDHPTARRSVGEPAEICVHPSRPQYEGSRSSGAAKILIDCRRLRLRPEQTGRAGSSAVDQRWATAIGRADTIT
jgi:hypothetical protein